MTRLIVSGLAVGAASLAFATGALAQPANIDVDEHRTSPVPHRYIHGRLGDAEFQIALPDNWNGKLLIGARGFSGDENYVGCVQDGRAPEGLRVRAQRSGLVPLRHHRPSGGQVLRVAAPDPAAHELHEVDRSSALRRAAVAHVHGGRLERRPQHEDDGGGLPSRIRRRPRRVRHHLAYRVDGLEHEVRAQFRRVRIAHRRHRRQAHRRPGLEPGHDPAQPAAHGGTAPGVAQRLHHAGAGAAACHSTSGVCRAPSTGGGRTRRGRSASTTRSSGYATTSVAKFDRFYDPNGDGVLSLDEIKAWDPNDSPPPVANDLRRFDNTGDLQRPVIIVHGSHDPIVSPGETVAYKRLVEGRFGVAGARDLLAVYFIPGMGHGGVEFDASLSAQLDALEAWVTTARAAAPPDLRPPTFWWGAWAAIRAIDEQSRSNGGSAAVSSATAMPACRMPSRG